MKLKALLSAIVTIVLMQNLCAQVSDTTETAIDTLPQVENVEVEDMVFEENPVKKVLDDFLPTEISNYIAINSIQNNIDENLVGCFKTYQNKEDQNKVIAINISKGSLPEIDGDNSVSANITSLSVSGYTARLTKLSFGENYNLKIEVNNKVVQLSCRGEAGDEIIKAFAQALDYTKIQNL